jgi:hypothetical protein
VAEKHDFCSIQRKILQVSDFAKNWDSNPPPHGDTAVDIAKMFAKKFCKNRILGRKTQFSRKSDQIFAKFPRLNRENRILRIITAKNTLCK